MTSVADLILARAEDDNTGLRFEERSWTWREVVEQCRVRAQLLEAVGRQEPLHGPRHVGVLLENVPEFLFLLGGAALAGAVLVGINPTRRGSELAADISHTDCQMVVTSTDLSAMLDGLDTGVEPERVLVSDTPEYTRRLEGLGVPRSQPGVPTSEQAGSSSLAESLYLLLFTSGSTGAPKAVRVSQGRIAAAATVMVRGSGFGAKDVLYCPMPMFHGNALFACVVPAIAAGATLVLPRRFSASGFIRDVHRYGVTYFTYVGRALAHILATPPSPDDGDNSLRLGFGTDASPRDMSAFKRRFGCPIMEGYGSSEGAVAFSYVPGTPPGAIGRPPPHMDAMIADPETGLECARARFDGSGRLLNASEAIGEIVSRDGAKRFEGYYRNPDAEAERTRGGWFWSGDLGYRDENDFFYFAGRPTDWLRVDGENFSAAPVERILARFDSVLTAAVYPVADPRTGDQVMAALELEDGAAFDPAAFAEFLEAQADLGTKWAPRFVRIVDHMPLTGTGKLDKRPLRKQRWTRREDEEVWWRPQTRRGPGRGELLEYRLLTEQDEDGIRRDFEANGRAELLAFPA